MQSKPSIPNPVAAEQAITWFASLPLAEIQSRAQAVTVPPDIIAQAKAKLLDH